MTGSMTSLVQNDNLEIHVHRRSAVPQAPLPSGAWAGTGSDAGHPLLTVRESVPYPDLGALCFALLDRPETDV